MDDETEFIPYLVVIGQWKCDDTGTVIKTEKEEYSLDTAEKLKWCMEFLNSDGSIIIDWEFEEKYRPVSYSDTICPCCKEANYGEIVKAKLVLEDKCKVARRMWKAMKEKEEKGK
jgi:hypothetical protein